MKNDIYVVRWGWYDDGECATEEFESKDYEPDLDGEGTAEDCAFDSYREAISEAMYGDEYGPGPDWVSIHKNDEVIDSWSRVDWERSRFTQDL